MVTFSLIDREFQRALEELGRISRSADSGIVFNTAKFLTRNLAFNTPLFKKIRQKAWRWRLARVKEWKGYARSGWQKAWTGLRLAGTPAIRNASLQRRAPGGIVDQSRRVGTPFITVFNDADFIEALDKKSKILVKAITFQTRQMNRSLDRIYSAMLRKKSG